MPRASSTWYPAGNWREDHLFNLASVLRIYDVLEAEIAIYDARLLEEIQALQQPERQDQPVPPHPNASKEKAIKTRGDQPSRLALWRFAGVDLARIDGIRAGAAQTVRVALLDDPPGSRRLNEPGPQHSAAALRAIAVDRDNHALVASS